MSDNDWDAISLGHREQTIDITALRSFVKRVKRFVYHADTTKDVWREDGRYQWDERYKIMEQCDKLLAKLHE